MNEPDQAAPASTTKPPLQRPALIGEDWLAVLVGLVILAIISVYFSVAHYRPEVFAGDSKALIQAGKGFLGQPKSWEYNPLTAFSNLLPIATSMILLGVIGWIGGVSLGRSATKLLPGLLVITLLAAVSYALSGQKVIKHYNLEYPLWALLIGLMISNTVGTPGWLKPAVMTEFFIKTGLVIMGAEILFGELVALGLPGVCIAWIVTPIVLITTFWFGQRVLKIESPSLNMVISADMSVCGVSAAIATAAACRAKKEELSLAIGLSLSFTVVMMVVLPPVIQLLGLSEIVGGAWIGGTIDSTGAVAAAGEMLGDKALKVASTVKLIQNILIGVVAFAVAAYWVRFVEPTSTGKRPGISEVWKRFPRFVLGFVAASIIFSLLVSNTEFALFANDLKSLSKGFRGWFFCYAFVCIGLDTNFKSLLQHVGSGKPFVLYIAGQTLNLVLTLAMAYVVFEVLFPGAADALVGATK